MSAIERSRSQLALDPRSRYLPAVSRSGFAMGSREPLAEALHRLTTEQFTIAINALSDPKADISIATAATLASIGRIAAVLRLVRQSIGDESYRTELNILSDTRNLLSELLEGQPELRALDQLRARYEPVLRPAALTDLRDQLLRRHQLRRLQTLSDGAALQQALHRLRRARARFAAWPIDSNIDAGMYGREPVSDSFESVSTGLGRTYNRGRKHWRATRKGDLAAVPKWQRECRHLRHQLEVLSSCWPEVIGATATSCAQLESVLAEDQALAALERVMTTDASLVLGIAERSLLDAVVANSRTELHEVADILGARIYIERTEQFIARMDAYWNANSAGFTS